MFRIHLTLAFTFFTLRLFAQPFQPDEFGHVNSQKFKTFIAKRGYKLAGGYYEITVGKKSMLVAKVLKGNEWVFIDVNGKEMKDPGEMLRIEQNIPEIILRSPESFPMAEPGPNDWISEKYESINSPDGKGFVYDGDTLAQPIYESILIYPTLRSLEVKKDNKYGVINEKGILVIPTEYDDVSLIPNGTSDFYCTVKKNGKTGIVSLDNRVTIPFEYEELTYMETYLRTGKRGKPCYGIVGLDGKEILPTVYTGVSPTKGNYFRVTAGSRKKRTIGLADWSGKLVVDTIYSDYWQYGLSGFLLQFDRNEPGTGKTISEVFDVRTGSFVFPREKYGIDHVAYNYGRVVDDRTPGGWLYGWVGMTGKLRIEPQYNELSATEDSPFLIVRKENKYGVVDSVGNTILPFNYEKLAHFDSFTFEAGIIRGDVFIITEGDKQGVINTKGQLLIPMEYESITTTSKGILCRKGDSYNIMNLQGQFYLKNITFEPNTFISPLDDEYGFIRTNGMIYDLYGNSLPQKGSSTKVGEE